MKTVRSFPLVVPENRAYVVDSLPKFYLTDFDYSGLAELADDVLLLEWDIAASKEDIVRLGSYALSNPYSIHVAPYRLYYPAPSHWAHRVLERGKERWLHGKTDARCHYFGFGMLYLPRYLIEEFLASPKPGYDKRLTDQTFSVWHHKTYQPGSGHYQPVDVHWDVRPIHLHF